MKILAIETSCDETAISILETEGNLENPSFKILSHIVHTQIDMHREYGGVFPTVAKREHGKNLVPVLIEALEKAGIEEQDAALEEYIVKEIISYKDIETGSEIILMPSDEYQEF